MTPPSSSGKKPTRNRVPKLCFTKNRGIGYYVSYRNPDTGSPTRHRFGMIAKAQAELAYHRWLATHLDPDSNTPNVTKRAPRSLKDTSPSSKAETSKVSAEVVPGSLAEVASGLLTALEGRVREDDAPRAQGTISSKVFGDRRKHTLDFLKFLKQRHGVNTVGRLRIVDLAMADVEEYNRLLVVGGYSSSQVNKRMQAVRSIVERAGRPEHGGQVLQWNWDSRDVLHGKPVETRTLPTLTQLKKVIKACELRERTMVWMAIGLGFGQRDLAAVRVGQIDQESYDLRRLKTGLERYGETPPLVWAYIEAYLHAFPRDEGSLLFETRTGQPLAHGTSDAVTIWWRKLRLRIGESKDTLQGFYVMRHLGASEFGSRSGCSINDVRRWLGHSASSSLADVYMKPIAPERKRVVTWVRERLASSELD